MNKFSCNLGTTFILTVSENNWLNQKILDEIIHQDYAAITNTIEDFLIEQIEKNKAKGLILGLSGGIDSAVLAYICKRILKEKTMTIIMPDTQITPSIETEDAMKMIALTGLEYKLIDINPIVSAQFVRLTDVSDINLFSGTGDATPDGYDLDAVKAFCTQVE